MRSRRPSGRTRSHDGSALAIERGAPRSRSTASTTHPQSYPCRSWSRSWAPPGSSAQLPPASRQEELRGETYDQDEEEQHSAGGPGLGVVRGIRLLGVLEDGQRNRLD